ncbi:MAG: LysR family transcriptional regulator [Thermoleophilia bacterium]|nr:LysR family transcriptional regulator [Thermoleophilia bacterium]
MADIHLLRTFLTVYRAGTFTRAAHELHLTQPAVSVQIRSLETQIGKPLFRREPRGVVPTAAGRELAQAVAPHVDALEGALDGSGEAAPAIGDTVHIGGPEEFLGVRVFPELAPMMEDGLRVRMFFGVDAPVLERLVDGELDIAVLTVDTRRQGIETQPLCFEYLDLVGTPAWRERLGDIPEGPAGADVLADVPLAAHDEELPLIRIYWQTVFRSSPHAHAMLVANSLRSSLQFAMRGVGVTVLPSHTTAEAVERGELVRLMTPTTPTRSRLYLAWRAGSLRRSSLAWVHGRIALAAREW